MRSRTCVLLALGLILAASPVMAQTTIWVPTQQPTIQAGIVAANNGDTVMVFEGTYSEFDIDFLGKAVRVRSFGGPAVTKIDAGESGRGVLFQTGEGPDSILEGFTIRNGKAPDGTPGVNGTILVPPTAGGAGGSGGGVLIVSSSPTIRDCVILECAAGDGGIGGSGKSGQPQHGQDGGVGGHGGGIHVSSASSPRIENCQVTNNRSGAGGIGGNGVAGPAIPPFGVVAGTSGGDGGRGGGGGGLSITPPSLGSFPDSFIVGCTFTGNVAGDGGDGGSGGNSTSGGLTFVNGGVGGAGGLGGEGGAAYVTYGKARFVSCRMFVSVGGTGGDGGAGGTGGDGATGGVGGLGGNGGTGGVRYGLTNLLTHEAFSCTIIAQNTGGAGGRGGLGGGQAESSSTEAGGSIGPGGAGGDGGAGGLHSVARLEVGSSNIHVNVAGFGGAGGAGGSGGATGGRLAGGIHSSGLGTDVEVFNSVVRGNVPDQKQGVVSYRYCNVQGGASGAGNIDAGASFVDWQNFDYRLDFDSPCIDAGRASLLPPDDADVDHDDQYLLKLPLDVDLEVRLADDLNVVDTGFGTAPMIDMGAHERSSFEHLGHGMPGVDGQPLLYARGTLVIADDFDLHCHNTLPVSIVWLVLSAARIDAPSKGGVMVPNPSPPAYLLAFWTNGSGNINFNTVWPSDLPSGFKMYMQCWISDPDGRVGYAASNGIELTMP
jgi:hypothetical protein